jgi:exopolyphosphatase
MLAYLRTVAGAQGSSLRPSPSMHIPLSNLPRADLSLRPEMTLVLRHAGLEPSDLLTLSDLPEYMRSTSSENGNGEQAQARSEASWLLVDHNALTGQLSRFAKHVTGVIDHHDDEGAVPPGVDPRKIEPCGSCMSLVIDNSKGLWESLALDAAEQARLARLGLAPVLIDTTNLTNKDKVTPTDEKAARFLEARARGADDGYDRARYYEEIQAVKEDLSPLNLRDILRKDYKEWHGQTDAGARLKLGISSVARSLAWLVRDKADAKEARFAEVLAAWADERELDLVAVMAMTTVDGNRQRDLVVWARSDGGQRAFRAFLGGDGGAASLRLETWCGGALDEGEARRAWRQGNLAASRKQVAPMLRDALDKAAR